MSRFYEIEPSLENYWRAVILFGRNTASYKFALAKALFDLRRDGKQVVTLEELAMPYSDHLCEHLKKHPKQAASGKSKYLDLLLDYNSGKIDRDEMLQQTIKQGFRYVLDAFHNVHGAEIGTRFFMDERKAGGGIQLTDELFKLGEGGQFGNIEQETEARWRLVEAAWKNKLSRNLMMVEYEGIDQSLIGVNSLRRICITSARPALNGYQKGRCFYCFREISISPGEDGMAEVDHFFPHILKQCDSRKPVDGVANLVLACQDCNRGAGGKFARLPSLALLERLFKRNEYLITSHHPLRETLIAQTGLSVQKRESYLQEAYNCSTLFVGGGNKWEPKPQADAVF